MAENNHSREDFQDQVIEYSLGTLSLVERNQFENEIAQAPPDRLAELYEYEEVVAQLGLSLDPVAPSTRVRELLMEKISQGASEKIEPARTQASHLDVFKTEGKWIKMFDGVYSKTLFVEPTNGYVTSLLKLDPGAHLPNHGHKGNEQCMILEGEFTMCGKTYGPGDFTVALSGSDHRDLFTATGAMVMLVSPPDYEFVVQ